MHTKLRGAMFVFLSMVAFSSPTLGEPQLLVAGVLGSCSAGDVASDRCANMVPDKPVVDKPTVNPVPFKFSFAIQASELRANWQPIIVIRKRDAGYEPRKINVSGHVLVLLGQRAPTGEEVFTAGYGFFPDGEGAVTSFSIVASSPKESTYQVFDLISETEFSAKLTKQQYSMVRDIISHWPKPNPSMADLDCVLFLRTISSYSGFNYTDFRSPYSFVSDIAQKNTEQSVFDYDLRELKRQEAVTDALSQELERVFHGKPTIPHYPGPPGVAPVGIGSGGTPNLPGGPSVETTIDPSTGQVCLYGNIYCI